METAAALFTDLIVMAALGGAAFALFVALVLSRRFDVAERRHRYEVDHLVRAIRRLEANNLQLHKNLSTIAGAGQRLAAEIERASLAQRVAQARRQQQIREMERQLPQHDEDSSASPPSAPPRVLH